MASAGQDAHSETAVLLENGQDGEPGGSGRETLPPAREINPQAGDFLAKYLLMLKMPSFLKEVRCHSIVGLLIMPMTISYGGLAFGAIGVLVLAIVCAHCNEMILQRNGQLLPEERTFNYISLVEKAFDTGPPKLRRFSSWAKYVTMTWMQLKRFMVCCTVYLFFTTSICELIIKLNGATTLSEQEYKLWLVAVVLFFNCAPQSEFVGMVSGISDYLLFGAFFTTFVDSVRGPFAKDVIPFISPVPKLPRYFGCIMYIFEVTSVILPTRFSKPTTPPSSTTNAVVTDAPASPPNAKDSPPNAMDPPPNAAPSSTTNPVVTDAPASPPNAEDLPDKTSVYIAKLIFVYFMHALLGFFGYLTYGPDVKPNIGFNIPEQFWLGDIARSAFIFALLVEYTIEMDMIVAEFGIKTIFYQRILGIALVFLTYGTSYLLYEIDQLVFFIGAFCVTPLVLVLPPILEILAMYNTDEDKFDWNYSTLVKDALLIIFGAFIIGICTAIVVITLIDSSLIPDAFIYRGIHSCKAENNTQPN